MPETFSSAEPLPMSTEPSSPSVPVSPKPLAWNWYSTGAVNLVFRVAGSAPTLIAVLQRVYLATTFRVGDVAAITKPLVDALSHVTWTAPNLNSCSPTLLPLVLPGSASESVLPTALAVNWWAVADAAPTASAHTPATSPRVILTLLILLVPRFRPAGLAGFQLVVIKRVFRSAGRGSPPPPCTPGIGPQHSMGRPHFATLHGGYTRRKRRRAPRARATRACVGGGWAPHTHMSVGHRRGARRRRDPAAGVSPPRS